MNEKRELPMDLRIMINDVTEYCNGKPDGVDKIFEGWLFDANLDVHICSFQANKECWFLGVTFTTTRDLSDEERETVWEYMDEVSRYTEPVNYFDGRIKGHPYQVVEVSELDEDEDDPERAMMEEHVEYLRCNSGYWECLVEETEAE